MIVILISKKEQSESVKGNDPISQSKIDKWYEDIINDEYNRDELKDFLRVDDEGLDEFINEVKNNSFLKSLELRTEERTLSGNARIVYTANLRLIGD